MHETHDGFMTVWGGGGWNSPHNSNNNNNTVVDAADCCSAACGVSLGGVQGLLTAAGPWFISPIILVPQRGASPRVTLQGAATCTVQYSHLLLLQSVLRPPSEEVWILSNYLLPFFHGLKLADNDKGLLHTLSNA